MAEEFVTVARLRAQLAELLGRLDRDGPVYVTQRGQPRAVLLDVERYRELMAQLEYLDDSLEVALARDRRRQGEATQPLADVIGELASREGKRASRPPRARVSH